MIYMTGSIGGERAFNAYATYPDLGMLMGPKAWRLPWCQHYAFDNDVYGAWDKWVKGETDIHPEVWWQTEGERKWLSLMDKAMEYEPLFCVLPDVVTDWTATIKRSNHYRKEIESRGMKTALALQDGCNEDEVERFSPDAIFIGGSTAWKWRNMERLIKKYKGRFWVHAARVNGTKRIRAVKEWGADSADGTGLCRHFCSELPKVVAGLYQQEFSPQLAMF